MTLLHELFDVVYGNKLDLNKMRLLPVAEGGVHFVGRSSENHGVSATVAPLKAVEPFESGLITVALGGTKLLSSFLQETPFYTAQNVAVLRPKQPMTFQEQIFVCLSIRHNRFRYSAFGREANRTLKGLPIPERNSFPAWVYSPSSVVSSGLQAPFTVPPPTARQPLSWPWFKMDDLFDIKKGKRLTKAQMVKGRTPFIGAIDNNNGLTTFINRKPVHEGNTITVNYNGNGVAEAFYQDRPFWCSDDVNVLYPKFALTPGIALFIATVIRLERYRFNYGRKWDLDRMRSAVLRLPDKADGTPDWEYMEQYVMSLPFSSQVVGTGSESPR
jgi:Type I restriction modification DNA specificity domain